MKFDDDPIFQDFINNRDLRDSTIKNYRMILTSYSKYTELTPEQLIDEAELEEEQGIKLRKRKIKQHLIGFKKYMEEIGYSPVNIKNRITIVRSFYNEFEIQLPRIRNKKIIVDQNLEDLPGKKDIIHALQFAGLKYKAIIILMASSGMGESEICNLKFKDFLDSINSYINGSTDVEEIEQILTREDNDGKLLIAEWHIQRFKTDVQYTTFSTYESIQMILLYLKSHPPEDINDYLFRARGKNKQLHIKVFNNYFYFLNFRAGYGYVNRNIFFRSHNLRKFFTNTLHKNKVREFNTKWLLGRKIGSTDERYFKSNVEDLRDDYITCIPDLSMKDIEIDTITTDDKKRMIEQGKQIDNLTREIEMLKEQQELRK